MGADVQSSSRKSLIATSAISVVLWVDKSPGINWIVDIDGAWTWLFLLVAHSYFFIMYVANDGLVDFGREFLFDVMDRHGNRTNMLGRLNRWMTKPFVTLLAIGGFGIILYSLATVAQSTATQASAVAL